MKGFPPPGSNAPSLKPMSAGAAAMRSSTSLPPPGSCRAPLTGWRICAEARNSCSCQRPERADNPPITMIRRAGDAPGAWETLAPAGAFGYAPPNHGSSDMADFAYAFPHRHLLGIEGLNRLDIEQLLDLGDRYVELNRRRSKHSDALAGQTLLNLFFENS